MGRNTPTVAQDVAREYASRYPGAATQTLARKAYKENPELWTSLDHCRGTFRYVRGAKGKQARERAPNKSQFRQPQKPGDPFGTLPDGIVQLEDYGAFHLQGPCSVLLLADIHVPYHDKAAVRLACQYVKHPDVILLNGDIIDCFAQSVFAKDPRQVDFKREVEVCKGLYRTLRKLFPHARVIHKWGNHEQRFQRYMWLKAPELLDIDDCQLGAILDCKEYGVEVVSDPVPIRAGKLYVVHGHEWKRPLSNPVNPARGLYLKAKVSCVCAHLHQSSQHSQPRLDEHVVSTWSSGCLCELHPEYCPVNEWNLGFMAMQIDKEGGFEVKNPRIIEGKVWD